MSSLVIGYDPTDRAKRACATGTKLAGALGAELHLVTAFEERSDGGSFETFKLESLLDQVGFNDRTAEFRCSAVVRGTARVTCCSSAVDLPAWQVAARGQPRTRLDRRNHGPIGANRVELSSCTGCQSEILDEKQLPNSTESRSRITGSTL
jgi:hypothetical protein